jgi:aspartyl-tRNA(Asn)/glutamyl-tRNA(Gln) amidotransferase subunit C
MKLGVETIRYVAKLARMKLSEEQIISLSSQLDSILKYIEKLNKVDTKDIQPTSHVLAIKNVYRQDKITASLGVEDALLNAPSKKSNLFKVPKIIE